ncbi:unnamed protein product [Porites evermanni]|uniref:Uncharacterized protein n=1 Tax=Porites evermanni TaxID=104178 RepID=A0ABN8LBD2_9CNID|nr:unnamed protein product [Porites evermanni]
MATKDNHILSVQEDVSKLATTSSGLKVVESDSDLRRKSLPSITPLNLQVSSAMEAPRSCSANDAYSQDTSHMACLLPSIETKAAFEDNSPLFPSQAGVKAKSGDEFKAGPRDTCCMMHATEDLGFIATASAEKDIFEDGQTEDTVTLDGPVPDVLFAPRGPSTEKVQFRSKRKSLAPSEVKSIDNEEATVLRSQSPCGESNDREQETEEQNEMGDEMAKENNEETNQNQHPGQERMNNKESISRNDTKISRAFELSDTMQPLAPLPFVQAGTSWRRSSTASLHHFPASPPSAFMGVPRSRRVSTVGSSIFSTPSTSAPPDTLQALQETSKRLPNESPQGTSGVPESRRGSQARRKSSVAASMLSSDTRDGKKGSIGFTLAASLVKWKKNSLRAARKANETIAKDAKHQEFMNKTADRIKTELPKQLLVSIQEEAYPIILRTTQAYRSQLGVKHKLTMQAYDRLADLVRDLKNPF